MTQTTISAAVTATTTQVLLTSITSLAVGMLIQVDNEYMQVMVVPSAATVPVTVIRGVSSRAVIHGSLAPAYYGTPDEFDGQGSSYGPQFADGLLSQRITPTAQVATAGAGTYTAGQVLSGMILRDPAGASRTDTLPTAALLIAAWPGCQIGSMIDFTVENQADAAETITVAAGTGGTAASGHTLTIAQSNSKEFRIRVTGITPGSEAYALYNRGTFTT